MNTVPFRPLGNRYLILPDPIEGESETIGEVTLSTPKDPHKAAVEGTVVARGKSCTELEIGDKVFYGQYSGYDQHLEGVDYKVLQESEILGEKIVTPFDADYGIPGGIVSHDVTIGEGLLAAVPPEDDLPF